MSGISAMFFGGTSYVFAGAWDVGSALDYGGGMALGYDASSIPYVVLSGYVDTGNYSGRTLRVNTLRETVWTRSTSSDVSAGPLVLDSSYNPVIINNTRPGGGGNFTVAKLNTSGVLTWQRKLASGGNGLSASGIGVDTSDNIYVGGYEIGGAAGFVSKYNSSGTLQWQRKLSSNSLCTIQSIAIDSSGNIITAGYYKFSGANTYAHITKYNSSGTLQWQKYVNQTATIYTANIPAMVCDSSGNIYFYMSAGSGTTNYNYYVKLDSSGAMQWTRRTDNDDTYSTGSAYIDADGYIYFVAYHGVLAGTDGTYIVKYDSSGTRQFDRKLTNVTSPSGIVVDNTGFMWVTGNTTDGTDYYIFLSRLPSDGPGSSTFSLGTPNGPITVAVSTPNLTQNTTALTIATSSLTDAAGTYTDSAGSLSTGTFSTTAYTAP